MKAVHQLSRKGLWCNVRLKWATKYYQCMYISLPTLTYQKLTTQRRSRNGDEN